MYSEDNLILQLAKMGGNVTPPPGVQAAPQESAATVGDRPLASVYAPVQAWRELYDEETALCRGTLFKELEFPFLGGGADA